MYDHWDRSPVSKSACHNSSACAPVLNSIKPAKTVVGSAEIMVGLLCARVSITVNNLVPPAGKIMGGSFSRSDAAQPYWSQPGFASAGVWHDVAMAVHWSSDPATGYAQVWLDGKPMGRTQLQTRVNDTDDMFTQIGLLRARVEAQEVILIDNVRAADNIEQVLAAFDPETAKACP